MASSVSRNLVNDSFFALSIFCLTSRQARLNFVLVAGFLLVCHLRCSLRLDRIRSRIAFGYFRAFVMVCTEVEVSSLADATNVSENDSTASSISILELNVTFRFTFKSMSLR